MTERIASTGQVPATLRQQHEISKSLGLLGVGTVCELLDERFESRCQGLVDAFNTSEASTDELVDRILGVAQVQCAKELLSPSKRTRTRLQIFKGIEAWALDLQENITNFVEDGPENRQILYKLPYFSNDPDVVLEWQRSVHASETPLWQDDATLAAAVALNYVTAKRYSHPI